MAKKLPCYKCGNPREADLHVPCEYCGSHQTIFGYMYEKNARYLYWTIGISILIIFSLLAIYIVVLVLTQIQLSNTTNSLLLSEHQLSVLKLKGLSFGGMI